MDDRELLCEYVHHQSEEAFAELVRRHVNLVYATARRVLGERSAAQDVVQSVFILLARRAWAVRDGNALPGWLYRAAYHTALDVLRSEQRRRKREAEAMSRWEEMGDTQTAVNKITPLLDEALRRLSRTEQDAVVLRYFEGKSLRETGVALSLTEQAVHKRVSRALEKMRIHFARHGITVGTVLLATAIEAEAGQAAPVNLAARVTTESFVRVGTAGVAGNLLKAYFMTTKTKIVIAAVVILMLMASVTFQRQSSADSHAQSAAANLWPTRVPAAGAMNSGTLSKLAKDELPSVSGAHVALPVVPVQALTAATGNKPVAEPRADLSTAIPELIRLLEARDYSSVVWQFVSPDELQKGTPPGMTPEDVIALVLQDPAFPVREAALLDALKAVRDQTPILDKDGQHATYELNPPIGSQNSIKFKKMNGLWYMDDN